VLFSHVSDKDAMSNLARMDRWIKCGFSIHLLSGVSVQKEPPKTLRFASFAQKIASTNNPFVSFGFMVIIVRFSCDLGVHYFRPS
jgi:hypothetical protein